MADNQLPAILDPAAQDETILMVRVLCPYAEKLQDVTILACVAFVEYGGDVAKVAQALSVSGGKASALCRLPVSVRVIEQLVRKKFLASGRAASLAALLDVAGSSAAPAAARVNAARVLDEIADKVTEREKEEGGGDAPDLADLSLEQLEQLADKIRLERRTIDGKATVKPAG